MELVMVVEAVSMTNNVMEHIVDMAWESIRTESAWRYLENDPEVRSVIPTQFSWPNC